MYLWTPQSLFLVSRLKMALSHTAHVISHSTAEPTRKSGFFLRTAKTDQTERLPRLMSLRWAQMSFCLICPVPDYFTYRWKRTHPHTVLRNLLGSYCTDNRRAPWQKWRRWSGSECFCLTSDDEQRRLIRVGRCPSWSQSSLDTKVILLILPCSGLFYIPLKTDPSSHSTAEPTRKLLYGQ